MSSSVGAALGTLLVTFLLDLSWPRRLLLVGLVVVAGLAWVLWEHRAEVVAGAADPAADPAASADSGVGADPASPADPPGPRTPPPAGGAPS